MDTDLMIDFASSLALLALLSWSYGILRRRLGGAKLAPVVLGGLFGFVALLQMHAPIEPAEGLIIDLRAVPVALAGAFLGRAGLVACMTVALGARYGIGGIGMIAGMTGIALAGAAGLIWHRMTAHLGRRRFRDLLGLAVCVSASLTGAVSLPAPHGAWFFSQAAPALAAAYLVAIPAIGALLERERIILKLEDDMKADARIDPASGLYTVPGFARRIAETSATGRVAPVRAVMVLELRHGALLSAHWGQAILGHVLKGLRGRVAGLVRHGDMLVKPGEQSIGIALTADEMARAADLAAEARRIIAERAIALPDGDAVQVRVDARVVPLGAPECEDVTIAALTGRPPVRRRAWRSRAGARKAMRPISHHALFVKADRLLAHREDTAPRHRL